MIAAAPVWAYLDDVDMPRADVGLDFDLVPKVLCNMFAAPQTDAVEVGFRQGHISILINLFLVDPAPTAVIVRAQGRARMAPGRVDGG